MGILVCLVLTAVVPGAGHLWRRQYMRASAFLLFFIGAIDGYVSAYYLVSDAEVQTWLASWSLLVMAVVWSVAMAHMLYLCFFFDEEEWRRRIDDLFAVGQEQYLRGEYSAALKTFSQGLKLNREDVDMRLYLGLTYRSLGRRHRAKRAFRRCGKLDVEGKWKWEIAEELKKNKTKHAQAGPTPSERQDETGTLVEEET